MVKFSGLLINDINHSNRRYSGRQRVINQHYVKKTVIYIISARVMLVISLMNTGMGRWCFGTCMGVRRCRDGRMVFRNMYSRPYSRFRDGWVVLENMYGRS